MKNLIVVLAVAGVAAAAQPDIRNAQLVTESAAPSLAQKVAQIEHGGKPAWFGYEVVSVRRHQNSYSGCGGVHYLEDDRDEALSTSEPASDFILFRTDGSAITKVDVLSGECHIDGGGMVVHWLTGVNGDDSVRLLRTVAGNGSNSKKLGDGLLLAIAIHEVESATRALEDFAKGSTDQHMKEQAAFWLGVMRGQAGFVALEELNKDPDADFRKKLTFDFSQNSDPRVVDELIHIAKTDNAPEVRQQAIFWLAQKAGKKQAALIADFAANDADTAVKKKAVFALTQIPNNEGVPELVKVAETNRDPAVRKDAVFWLGQSKDPRALEYLEQVLKR